MQYHYNQGYYSGGNGCGCVEQVVYPCSPCSSNTGQCPIKLDASCILYHKDMNTASLLTGLGLPNGSTVQLILETIDTYIQQLKVSSWTLTFLRTTKGFTIGTLQQFGQAVDTELADLQTQITNLAASAAVSLLAIDSNSIDFTTSGTLDHTLTANVKISANSGNQASILSDGVMVTPQTLTLDYVNKKLSISDGNTVDFASITCGVGGYLGSFTSDPSAVDGQYWYRSDTDQLKIQLNSSSRIITIT